MAFAVLSLLHAQSLQWLSGEVTRDKSGDGGFGRESQMLLCPGFPSLPVPSNSAAAECRSSSLHTGQLCEVKGFLNEQKWLSKLI